MCSRENEDLNNGEIIRGFVKQLISCVNACPIFEGQNENETCEIDLWMEGSK